jgi:hypothetical protein
MACLAICVATAHASSSKRVVLADPDPELLRAVVAALGPWRLEVVTGEAPVDGDDAQKRAEAEDARFVVWRAGSELIVFDRESGRQERRDAPTGALDAVDATAAALTVKTLMRLPPPETVQAPPPAVTAARAGALRLQAGLATRIAHGSETSYSARFLGSASLRPSDAIGLRLGAAVEIGTSSEVGQSGFKGTWTDWSAVALASWSFASPRWELEPYAGGGVTRSGVAGIVMGEAIDEAATLGVVRAGVWVRRRLAMWRIGVGLGAELRPGTPTYTRPNGNQKAIFDVPGFGVEIAIIAGADFGG